MGYKKATHEQTKLNKLIDRQQNGGSQRGRGWERMKKVPGVKYTTMGGDWMSGVSAHRARRRRVMKLDT